MGPLQNDSHGISSGKCWSKIFLQTPLLVKQLVASSSSSLSAIFSSLLSLANDMMEIPNDYSCNKSLQAHEEVAFNTPLIGFPLGIM